jgi:excisionase family DNA binding protein
MPTPTIDWISETCASLKPLATAAEAADTLRVSKRTLARYVATGRIKAIRGDDAGSSRVLIPRSEVERFLRGLAAA